MTSCKTALVAPASIQSGDSRLRPVTDSANPQRRPLDVPRNIDRNESSDGYSNLVAVLNRKWRIVQCRDGIQWILQSRDSLTALTGIWRSRSYCRTKEALLRVSAAHAGEIAPTAAAVLARLPDWIEARGLCRRPRVFHLGTGQRVGEAQPNDRN